MEGIQGGPCESRANDVIRQEEHAGKRLRSTYSAKIVPGKDVSRLKVRSMLFIESKALSLKLDGPGRIRLLEGWGKTLIPLIRRPV